MLVTLDCEARGRVASEVQEDVPVGSVYRRHSTSLPVLFPSCAGADGSYLSLVPTLSGAGNTLEQVPRPTIPHAKAAHAFDSSSKLAAWTASSCRVAQCGPHL